MSNSAYRLKRDQLSRQLHVSTEGIRLEKAASNPFHTRVQSSGTKLQVRSLNEVIAVHAQGQIEVEGMTTYGDLTDPLARNCMPMMVAQLKSITIGGAVSGIESTSFRYGPAHETVKPMEVLLADGETIECSPHNEQAELFFVIPKSR